MSAQRYERVAGHDDETTTTSPQRPSVPNSPPPSFRSRASSFAHHNTSESQRLVSDADRTLADTFDAPSDDDSSDDGRSRSHTHRPDERQRALSARPRDNSTSSPEHASNTSPTTTINPPAQPRRTTQLSSFFNPRSSATTRSNQAVNDGVFANLSAKPTRGEEADEKPPTYEQAAADATPPYWETTILSPGASSDDVYIDGLPVGSLFSFLWNGMISASFQLVGFLLTYLLHTTHAAKHGSKAGLGITLIQYGFGMRSAAAGTSPGAGDFVRPPADPNNHDFDPNAVVVGAAAAAQAAAEGGVRAMQASDWLAYALMIAGWFILVRALGEYFKARRHEQLVLQSPGRGLNVAIVAEGERPETAV